jgi:hypothetical protein
MALVRMITEGRGELPKRESGPDRRANPSVGRTTSLRFVALSRLRLGSWAGPVSSLGSRPCWSVPGFPRELCGPASRVPLSSMESLEGYIGTLFGLRFWPLLPNPDAILLEDIAHELAHQGRFGGHASKFYSVAGHSVDISRLWFARACPLGPAARRQRGLPG